MPHCRLIALSPSLLTAPPYILYILFPISTLYINKRHGCLHKPCLYFLTDWICSLLTSLPAEHKNRQYNNRKRADTYYPVSVIGPVHLLLVFHALKTLFQFVIGFTFHALLLSFHAYEPGSFSSRSPSRSTPHFPAL